MFGSSASQPKMSCSSKPETKETTETPKANQVVSMKPKQFAVHQRSNLENILAQRKKLIDSANAVVELPLPPSKVENSDTQIQFTPIKSKELLAKTWASRPQKKPSIVETASCATGFVDSVPLKTNTAFVDDATIKMRREALVHGLKLHLSAKNVDETLQSDCNDDTFHPDQGNEPLLTCLEVQTMSSFDASPESGSSLGTITLHNCTILSPINERSTEIDSSSDMHQNESDDSDSGRWVLPVVNELHPKENRQTACLASQYTEKIGSKIKAFAERMMHCLSPCLWCLYDQCKSVTVICLTGIAYIFVFVANAWKRVMRYINDRIEEWFMLWLANIDNGTASCIASFHVAMMTEISTVAPRYSCGVTALLWCFQTNAVSDLFNRP